MYHFIIYLLYLTSFAHVNEINNIINQYNNDIYPENPYNSDFSGLNTGSGTYTKWSCPIPFTIDASIENPEEIMKAMEYLNNKTGWSFVERNSQNNYINFTKLTGCWSYLGMQEGGQPISIGNGCNTVGIILHEIAHSIGLTHEQSRLDRDDYVKIVYENIPTNRTHNFVKDPVINYDDYDFESIMHYGQWAFSLNGQKTIEPISKDIPKTHIGQRYKLSARDILHLNNLIDGAHCSTADTISHDENNIIFLGGHNINTFNLIFMIYEPNGLYLWNPQYRSKWKYRNKYITLYRSLFGYWRIDYNGQNFAYNYETIYSKIWYIYNSHTQKFDIDNSSYFEYEQYVPDLTSDVI